MFPERIAIPITDAEARRGEAVRELLSCSNINNQQADSGNQNFNSIRVTSRSFAAKPCLRKSAAKSTYHLNLLCPSITIFRAASASAHPAISVFLPSSAL
jgi:hypothetical protein